MRDVRQVFWGIVTALVSIALLFGVLSLSLAEGNMRLSSPTLPSTSTPMPSTRIPTRQPSPSLVFSPTPLSPTLPFPTLPSPTRTPTRQPSPSLGFSPTPLPHTPTPTRCGAPPSWVIYIVQPGDTLYHLGQAYGIPFTDIMRANCLTDSNIHVGQRLYLPPWATRTPSPTWWILPSDTPWAPWTETPTPTDFFTPTETGTPTDTDTPEPTPTPTPTPTV